MPRQFGLGAHHMARGFRIAVSIGQPIQQVSSYAFLQIIVGIGQRSQPFIGSAHGPAPPAAFIEPDLRETAGAVILQVMVKYAV
jgi:hypothetical protein